MTCNFVAEISTEKFLV